MAWMLLSPSKYARRLCVAPDKSFVRGVVLAPREMRRATLVEPRCEEHQVVRPGRVLEFVVSTSRERV
jgi:hypothetical protein